ncbi:hypothetical protein BYT27DRAFT_7159907 [Phlegmacium glaucopus]|nr:hypothetical protein BYT27DRAFT_7159907 [Phlegmacium glaucopus]
MLSPEQLVELLKCPICNRVFTNPTTLFCGHSICSHHNTVCCTLNIPLLSTPNIPSHSRVTFNPAPRRIPSIHPIPRTSDVTLNAILTLAHRSNEDRPRKRLKRHHSPDDDDDNNNDDDGDLLTHLRNAALHQRSIPSDVPLIQSHTDTLLEFDKKLLEELTCHICYVLFHRPVTTPCQHTFCSKCLQRSLDHGSSCPICRQEIPSFYFQEHPLNETIMNIILKAYPILYQERADAIEEEERHARLNTPIFVCQLSFPGIPIVLHFFEPRYRLMLRRCLESPNPFFGMIMCPKAGYPPVDYGTILDIKSVQMLPDGRSMVETWGSTRFRILERGNLDGYMVGRIERIYDYRDDLTETLVIDEPTPQPLIRPFLDRLQRGAAPWVVQRLSSTCGAMPTDPALFSFWVALVLPIEEREKAKLLPIKSARLRLLLVVHWIEQLNSNWWYSSGCTIL